MKSRLLQIGLSVASLALAATLVIFMPQVVATLTGKHVSWSQIGAQFAALSPGGIALMAGVWLLSLLAYTFVLTASLPGLTHLQALTLNASGSAVSNLLPFGGAAGVAMTFAMTRGWGFPIRAVVVSTLTSGIWNTLFRFLLPAVGIMALLISGQPLSPSVTGAGWAGAVSILVLVAVVITALYWDRAADVLGRGLDALVRLFPGRIRPGEHAVSEALAKLRADTSEIVRSRWAGLTLGMVFFLGFQWLILVVCLHATGAYPGLAQSIAAFALSRILTTALVTPSGAGIMEAGTVGALVFFGAPLDSATAAALLFGFWTYTVEIPFGGLALGAWSFLRRRENAAPAPEKEPISR
ncbi:flippase-like domain-containing protein [Streptosporangium sp. NBC_01755]|uniref:lysylphosphatidylglycerol synthase transmembrane domain-containing protein n=1 Tax=unclassified Streptosporangium TaxID=2632669 RepID=UPI002DDB6D4D|nr:MULTISPECIES: lysylphosphatidylglycerol synthase transmembrane domain-containing protein [unclassified Streptosporangium]WSA26890.1 flippase-like domain-containing protein [Streptosporangium sp. NBC_01810]WSD01685.1 flippase-like domain-containing protein [Streptosporangium sp. NBC_01755]